MNHYDLDLAALTMGQAGDAAACAAKGWIWSEVLDACLEPDTGPDDFFSPPHDGGNGGNGGAGTNEIALAVGGAAVLAAAIYFWRR